MKSMDEYKTDLNADQKLEQITTWLNYGYNQVKDVSSEDPAYPMILEALLQGVECIASNVSVEFVFDLLDEKTKGN